jgi:hypothetical protein
MDTPVIMLTILGAYVVSICVIKRLMKHRQPFELRAFMFVYNAAQVIASFYIFLEVG